MAQFSVTRQNYYPTKQNADVVEMFIPTDQYGYPGDHVHIVVVGSGVISQADVALNWLDD